MDVAFCALPGDGVKALGEYCWDQENRMGLILLMYFLFMPLYYVNYTILFNSFHFSFIEIFLMLAKFLCTFQYKNVR